ncbi:hypothetical protein OROGR_011056 [Orobanche gracilis]
MFDNNCRNCGKSGHFAKDCRAGTQKKKEVLIATWSDDDEEDDMPQNNLALMARSSFNDSDEDENELMQEKDHTLDIPAKQRMERQESLAKEHSEEYKAALRRAVTLAVPHAFSPSQYGTFDEKNDGDSQQSIGDCSTGSSAKSNSRESWDELIDRLFERGVSGNMVLKKPTMDDSMRLSKRIHHVAIWTETVEYFDSDYTKCKVA